MNIIIPDIDKYIVNLVDLRSLTNLLLVNKFFYEIIIAKPVMDQQKQINDMQLRTITDIFIEACGRGFLEYTIYLVNENKIDIRAVNDYAFRYSCRYGHLKLAQWLICLGESSGYSKIDIRTINDYAFGWSCEKGYLELAQWLVCLGESSGYTKIDIHANDDYAFGWSCVNKHLELAQWLVQLGESSGYGKFGSNFLIPE